MVFVYKKLVKLSQTQKRIEQTVTKEPKKYSRRCNFCHKRVAISAIITCRCGLELCSQHIHSDTHYCSYDYKQHQQYRAEQEIKSFGSLVQKVVKI
jgi:hypothetical protein